jgi:hypothetical protein
LYKTTVVGLVRSTRRIAAFDETRSGCDFAHSPVSVRPIEAIVIQAGGTVRNHVAS